MKNFNLKSLIPVIAAIVIFVVLTLGYFSPVLKGKAIEQHDIQSHIGISKETVDFRNQFHEEPLWTNSLFGGMPTFQISTVYSNNYVQYIHKIFTLGLPHPVNAIFIALISFFILLRVLKINPWLSIAGAIGFAFSTYFFIILGAGHNSKAVAIAYIPLVVAGFILVTQKKYLLGGALTALFLSLEINANHLQMTYYLFLFLGVYLLFEYVRLIKEKAYKDLIKISATLFIATILSFGPNAANLWATNDYVKYTNRGKSDLTPKDNKQTDGVSTDYATDWSMGKAETMTLMIPGFKGRSSGKAVGENKNALKNVDPQMKENIANTAQYWGDQDLGTSSPYSGAIIVFLFVLGLFIVEGRFKWVILATTIFSMMLSWGKNFMPLTEFFLDYFPVYNKFRAVSTILIIAEFTIPLLAVLAMDKLLKTPDYFKQKIKLPFISNPVGIKNIFFISFGLTGGLSLLYYLMPGLTDFFATGEYDKIYNDVVAQAKSADIAQAFMDNLETARQALFKSDAIRSFFFILLAAGVVWMMGATKTNKNILIAALAILILLDLALVDKGFLSDKNFKSKTDIQNPFPATLADTEILQDKGLSQRVLNLTVNTFNDASTSYYHKSVGGYHAAKLKRYQEMIENHIIGNMQNIGTTLNSNPTDSSLRATFAQQGVLNMLNTKYVIYKPDAPPLQNPYALGNAWFVNDIKMAKNADEEIKLVGEINPASVAVVDERFKDEINGFVPKADVSASIKLTEYKANQLKYESNSASDQLAVFSEIYYPDGWKVMVDGKESTHFRANYILRAMKIPAGKHTIEFKFEPKQYYTGQKIALGSSLILIIVVAGALLFELRKKMQNS